MFQPKSSVEFFMLRKSNWLTMNSTYSRNILPCQATPPRLTILDLMMTLKIFSLKKIWKKTPLKNYKNSRHHQSLIPKMSWTMKRRWDLMHVCKELAGKLNKNVFSSSHSSKIKIGANLASLLTQDSDPFSTPWNWRSVMMNSNLSARDSKPKLTTRSTTLNSIMCSDTTQVTTTYNENPRNSDND